MPTRLDVLKTYKLFIDGKFPRSESGRSLAVADASGRVIAHLAKASRKDLRDAVEAARRAQPGWSAATPYNRGQVLYRMAEMMEGKRRELEEAIAALQPLRAGTAPSKGRTTARSEKTSGKSRASTPSKSPHSPADEVAAAIDRLVCFAGWADKYAQVLGCNNPVAGPYYNFTVPEPTGVVAAIAPDECPLLALVSLIAPPICAGNAVVALASEPNPIPAAVFAEVCATSDVPPGVINILTGERAELVSHIASHRDIDAINAAGLSAAHSTLIREGVAENLKRVVAGSDAPTNAAQRWFDTDAGNAPWRIEPFVEMKTIWHPAAV